MLVTGNDPARMVWAGMAILLFSLCAPFFGLVLVIAAILTGFG